MIEFLNYIYNIMWECELSAWQTKQSKTKEKTLCCLATRKHKLWYRYYSDKILSVTFYGIQDVLDLSKQPNITTKRYKKQRELLPRYCT